MDNGYQKIINSKIFNRRLTNNHSLSQSQQKNASHRYPRGRDHNEHKFAAR